jgi:hypothetical protein
MSRLSTVAGIAAYCAALGACMLLSGIAPLCASDPQAAGIASQDAGQSQERGWFLLDGYSYGDRPILYWLQDGILTDFINYA